MTLWDTFPWRLSIDKKVGTTTTHNTEWPIRDAATHDLNAPWSDYRSLYRWIYK